MDILDQIFKEPHTIDEAFKLIESQAKFNLLPEGSSVDGYKERYIKRKSGFEKFVPKKNQKRVWELAWDYGHSCGYHEVYLYLEDLVSIWQ